MPRPERIGWLRVDVLVASVRVAFWGALALGLNAGVGEFFGAVYA
jgi:hypothetical protein